MTLDYLAAGELLERWRAAWLAFDGDAWTDLFTDDVEFRPDPFEPPLVGRNEMRAYLLRAARRQGQLDVAIERHWVAESTVLAAWHASYVERPAGSRVRIAGFSVAEIAGDGRIRRLREWMQRRATPAE